MITKLAVATLATSLPMIAGCKHPVETDAVTSGDQLTIATANAKLVTRQIAVTGVLQAEQRTDLAANSSGRVTQVFVEIGQRVAAGTPLAQLDSSAASARVKVAGGHAGGGASGCGRWAGLLAKGAITRFEYDQQMSQCNASAGIAQSAAGERDLAKQDLANATIRAPFAGIVTDKMVHLGDTLGPTSPVVTLLSDGQLRMRLTIPESELAAAREGAIVTFETVGLPGKQFRANLNFISHEVRAQTRDLLVEAIVPNETGALLPGMFVTAHLASGQVTLPVVPRSAVILTESGPRVMIAVGDRFEERVVQTGAFLGNGEVAISDGLKAGERVVVRTPENPAGNIALN